MLVTCDIARYVRLLTMVVLHMTLAADKVLLCMRRWSLTMVAVHATLAVDSVCAACDSGHDNGCAACYGGR
eukprot:366422-Chlamydomonas_euryale.AAC.8